MAERFTLHVNGREHAVEADPDMPLLYALRNDLGLNNPKFGCGLAQCGACTVLVDGKMVSACLMLTIQAAGAEVTTIEGLAKDGELDPLQKSFIEYGGFQCGICTPGQIMAARSLLDEIPHPTEDQVKEWMMGNLCRCTGYYKIIESIMAAAQAPS